MGFFKIAPEEEKAMNSITCFDFETATSAMTSACALGIVVIEKNEIIHSEYHLIKPPRNRYDADNIAIHGITPEMTQDAPDFAEIWPKIRHYFDYHIAAHYANFDIKVLAALLKRIEAREPDPLVYCTCIAARQRFPELRNHKLPTVCKKLGIKLDHHDALSDARAVAEIMIKMPGSSLEWNEAKSTTKYKKIFFDD